MRFHLLDIQIIEWLYHTTKASNESSKTGSSIHLSINLTSLYDMALPFIDPEDFHRSTKLSAQRFMTTPILLLTRDGAVWRDTTATTSHHSSLGSTDHTKSTSTLRPDRVRQMWTRATKFSHIVNCETETTGLHRIVTSATNGRSRSTRSITAFTP